MISGESYLITYEHAIEDCFTSETEEVELYDLSDEIVVQERANTSRTLEILKSERPGFTASREIGEEKMRV